MTDPKDELDIDLPDNWHWGIGERSSSYYSYWLFSDRVEDGYDGEVYWDEGEDHRVNFYETNGYDDDGDPIADEHPCYSSSHDSEREAVEDAIKKAHELEE